MIQNIPFVLVLWQIVNSVILVGYNLTCNMVYNYMLILFPPEKADQFTPHDTIQYNDPCMLIFMHVIIWY